MLVSLCGRPQMPIGRAGCHFALNLGILKNPIKSKASSTRLTMAFQMYRNLSGSGKCA
ncbi:hypothetical protein BN2476_230233 [Paraburkholderia piptadeniae]|uniref:Uncharacterized protein n=1 Tax=Paraburkholderia piptadeniae TaxID=1701573 RepID=A0A1N7RXH3_9BURK|nr:hypothetical protein BN2476_230233 [Paraburkholderia piptadeniae]